MPPAVGTNSIAIPVWTPNPFHRLIRALKMTVLFMWMLLDMVEKEIDSDIDKAKALQANSK